MTDKYVQRDSICMNIIENLYYYDSFAWQKSNGNETNRAYFTNQDQIYSWIIMLQPLTIKSLL